MKVVINNQKGPIQFMDDPFDLKEVPYIGRSNYEQAKSMGRVKKNPILEKGCSS